MLGSTGPCSFAFAGKAAKSSTDPVILSRIQLIWTWLTWLMSRGRVVACFVARLPFTARITETYLAIFGPSE